MPNYTKEPPKQVVFRLSFCTSLGES